MRIQPTSSRHEERTLQQNMAEDLVIPANLELLTGQSDQLVGHLRHNDRQPIQLMIVPVLLQ